MKKDIDTLICRETDTIRHTMKVIGEGRKKIAFVLELHSNKIIGTVSDGDIRRALLDGLEMSDSVSKCMYTEFTYINNNNSNIQFFSAYEGINIIPVVDDDMNLLGYEENEQNYHIPVASPQFGGNELKYLTDAFLSTWISSTGEYIEKFEKMFAEYCGIKYSVATSNGTTALHIALLALDVGVGDEVIVPDITFAATINAVLYTGATPVIVDIEEDSWCISPDEIRKAITTKTKAIVPVHIYGQPCDMGEIMQIANEHNIYVIEDCAEAHGAEYNGRKVGSFGHINCFSFFGNKVITTGEGGMCLTNDKALEEKMRLYRDHGMSKERKYYHEVVGYNYRMTNLQAAIGLAQLERIEEILEWRQQLEDCYYEQLQGIDGVTLQKKDLPNRKKIVWLVSILVDSEKRENIVGELKDKGIDIRRFFMPLSEMKIYNKYVFSNNVSRRISICGINLPTAYDVSKQKIDLIVKEIINGLV